jgi:SAM-dependent methyltransferase
MSPAPCTNPHSEPPVRDGTGVVESMQDYYRRRAEIYERVYHKPERQDDLRAMEAWLGPVFADRRVLELACGTGWWTPHGARLARHWLATDLNPETMALARHKPLPADRVAFATVDVYGLQGLDPAASFDAVFAGCWWSHVPLQRLPSWLDALRARLQPGARVVFLDNSYVQASNHPITHRDAFGNTYQTRTLDDGSVHEVLKNFPTPEAVLDAAGPQARDFNWTAWTHYWAAQWTWA